MKNISKLGLRVSFFVAPLCFASLSHAASQPRMSVGGYFTQSATIVDIDDAGVLNLEDEALDQNAEVHFKGVATLDSGTEIGIRVELEASDHSDQVDEHYLFIRGPWGKLIVGAENGVAHLAHAGTARFVPGLSSHDNELTDEIYFNSFNTVIGNHTLSRANITTSPKVISGDANKVSFFTPKVAGVQIGGSFAPNNENANGGSTNFGNLTKQEDIFELSLGVDGAFNKDWGYEFSLASVRAKTVGVDQDVESDSIAASVSYQNWNFGFSQTESENLEFVDIVKYAGAHEIVAQNIAISYRDEAYSFGASMLQSEESNSAGGVEVDFEELTIGGGYKLSNGVSFGYFMSQAEVELPQELGQPSMRINLFGLTLDLRF